MHTQWISKQQTKDLSQKSQAGFPAVAQRVKDLCGRSGGMGHGGSADLILGLGTSIYSGCSKKKKKKVRQKMKRSLTICHCHFTVFFQITFLCF